MTPISPTTFQELVEADLRRAARIIITVQDELDPQFRIASPSGDWWLPVTLPADEAGRARLFEHIHLFLRHVEAMAFVLATELQTPDAVIAFGISRSEQYVCQAPITREPRPWSADNFGVVEWLVPSMIDPVLMRLLPNKQLALTDDERRRVDAWFGNAGMYPAVQISGAS